MSAGPRVDRPIAAAAPANPLNTPLWKRGQFDMRRGSAAIVPQASVAAEEPSAPLGAFTALVSPCVALCAFAAVGGGVAGTALALGVAAIGVAALIDWLF